MLRRVVPAALVAAALASAGCRTTWSEIHGPNAALGFEGDHDGRFSPRIEAGYHWLYNKDMLGVGAGGVVAYSPVTEWVQVLAELNAWAFPLFGFPYTPFTFRLGAGFHPDEVPMLAFSVGLGGVLYQPPDSDCHPPLEGPWEGCPAGGYRLEDTVYPDMVSRVQYLFTMLADVTDGGCALDECLTLTHTVEIDTIFAWWLLLGAMP